MSIQDKYAALQKKRAELDARSKNGDRAAQQDRAKVAGEIRAMEREGARAGKVLSATVEGDKVSVDVKETDSLRDLQKEYCRGFERRDGVGEYAAKVRLKDAKGNVFEGTMGDYHRKRLLGK